MNKLGPFAKASGSFLLKLDGEFLCNPLSNKKRSAVIALRQNITASGEAAGDAAAGGAVVGV